MNEDSNEEHEDEEIAGDQTSGSDDASMASAQPPKVTGEVETKKNGSSAVKSIFHMLILLGGLVVGGGRALRRIAPDTYSTLTRLFDAAPDVSRTRPSFREQPRKFRILNPEIESLDLQPKSMVESGRTLSELGQNIADLYREVDQMFQDQEVLRHDLIRSQDDQRNLAILCALLHEVSIERVLFDTEELDRHQEFYAKAQECLGPLPQNARKAILGFLFQASGNFSSTNRVAAGNPLLSERKVQVLLQLRAVREAMSRINNDRHESTATGLQAPLP